MASMSRDNCWMCHHNQTDTDPAAFKKCIACHESSFTLETMNSPHLKAAFNQQCISCHMNWAPDTKCAGVCHNKNKKGKDVPPPSKRIYPTLKRPSKLVYKTPKQKKTTVTFFHNAHTDMFGATCGDCHKNTTCEACHDRKRKAGAAAAASIPKGKGIHYKCDACHDTIKSCTKCHASAERSKITFKHADTGFPLEKYHASVQCHKCHVDGDYNVGANCANCHKVWPKTFNHAGVTGFDLRNHHLELPCDKCHGRDNYNIGSSCTSCHKDWNNKTFDHAKITGFPLKQYHAKLECVKCHGTTFKKLPSDCGMCHKSWPSDFDHGKTTGLTLGENHSGLACDNCHTGTQVYTKPTCDMCHEGYTYPDVTPEY
jgi:hypothetical protein